MARSRSSQRWMQRHVRDPYVRDAQRSGYRSRASYKLIELDRKAGLLRRGQTVVDLGAAPGGWSQVAAERVGGEGRVIAVDRLPMDPIAGVSFLQVDFEEPAGLDALLAALPPAGADLVLSDLAPNLSGMKDIDQPRAMVLAELAADLARRVLRPSGAMVVKLFQGEGFDAWLGETRAAFRSVRARKPSASRSGSREVYAVAQGFLGEPARPAEPPV